MRKIIVLCLLAISLIAGNFEEATLAYEKGNFKAAFRLFNLSAKEGHSDALNSLGVLYSVIFSR